MNTKIKTIAMAGDMEYKKRLCEALGLDSGKTRHIEITIPISGPITIDAIMYVDEEDGDAFLDALKKYGTMENAQ